MERRFLILAKQPEENEEIVFEVFFSRKDGDYGDGFEDEPFLTLSKRELIDLSKECFESLCDDILQVYGDE